MTTAQILKHRISKEIPIPNTFDFTKCSLTKTDKIILDYLLNFLSYKLPNTSVKENTLFLLLSPEKDNTEEWKLLIDTAVLHPSVVSGLSAYYRQTYNLGCLAILCTKIVEIPHMEKERENILQFIDTQKRSNGYYGYANPFLGETTNISNYEKQLIFNSTLYLLLSKKILDMKEKNHDGAE